VTHPDQSAEETTIFTIIAAHLFVSAFTSFFCSTIPCPM